MKSTSLFQVCCASAAALLLLLGTPCQAREDSSTSTDMASALRVGSGPDGKLYQLLVRDMQTVCGSTVPLVNVPTVGGIPNLLGLSASQLELGIVQLDTLRQIGKDGDENIQTLQAVMPLHTNLLHMLSLHDGYRVGEYKRSLLPWSQGDSREIRYVHNFTDLKNQSVAAVGSTILLGQKLSESNNLNITFRKAANDDEAIKMLKDMQVQAVFTDGGWPLPSITRLHSDSGLALVEYDLPAQSPFVIVKRNYENMDAFNLKFLGSPNLLVTRPFKPNGEMGKRVAALQSCLLRHLEQLQEGRFQAAWKEIKSPNDTLGVTRFPGGK